jgi:hypothetical protein
MFRKITYKRLIEPPAQYRDNIVKVAIEIQKLRDFYKDRIYISSAYRIKEFNSSLATAAKDSDHLTGLAIDAVPLFPIELERMMQDARDITKFNAYGIYDTWLHLGIRDQAAYWDGRTKKR